MKVEGGDTDRRKKGGDQHHDETTEARAPDDQNHANTEGPEDMSTAAAATAASHVVPLLRPTATPQEPTPYCTGKQSHGSAQPASYVHLRQ